MEIRRFFAWLSTGFGARWQSILLIAAVNSGIAGITSIDDPRPFWHPFVSTQCLGFSVAYFVNLFSPWTKRRAILNLLVAVCLGAATGTLLIILVKQYPLSHVMSNPGRFLSTALSGFFLGLFVSLFYFNQWREAMNQAALHKAEADRNLLRQQATEAQLKLMQAQVEPHFLFNTLSGVQFLIESDPKAASKMMDHLIQYLRAAIPQLRQGSTTLGQEMKLAQAYLSILQMRMGRRLTFDIERDQALDSHPFPPMMLLSLVENAIKHGLEPEADGGHVAIRAGVQDGRLVVGVVDNGRGLGEDVGDGVGLSNIRDRLRALFGDAARIDLQEVLPRGVEARITLPYGYA
jgi:sensor histidine kinase YesM